MGNAMARVALAVKEADADGMGSWSYQHPGTGSGNGFSLAYDATRRTIVHCYNNSGGDETITILTPGTVDGNAIAERTIVIATGQWDEFSVSRYVYMQSDGDVYIDFAVGGANVSCIGVKVPY